MVEFIAERIKSARDLSLEDGQEKYKAFFVKPVIHIYEKYRAGVDTILTTDGYGDCIVED